MTPGTAGSKRDRDSSTWERNRVTGKMSEILARQVIADLVQAGRQPGDMLPAESEMMALYGVARATVREALRLLEVQGLIRIKRGPGGGPVLIQPTPADFAKTAKLHLQMRGVTYSDLGEARRRFEPFMAGLAATHQDAAGLAELRRVMQESERVDINDERDFQRNATEFHEVLARMSGNSVLDLLGATLQEVYRTGATVRSPMSRRRATRAIHARIADAVFGGDAQVAEQLMRDHLNDFDRASKRQRLSSVDRSERIRWE
jgi:DNA-binding FadR family transcriptional regulator